MTKKPEEKTSVNMRLRTITAKRLSDLIYTNRGTTRDSFITRAIELVRKYGMTSP